MSAWGEVWVEKEEEDAEVAGEGEAYSGEIVSSGSKEGSGLMFVLPALEWRWPRV